MVDKKKLIINFLKRNGRSSTSKIAQSIKSNTWMANEYLEVLESEKKILEHLTKYFPEHSIYSEEEGMNNKVYREQIRIFKIYLQYAKMIDENYYQEIKGYADKYKFNMTGEIYDKTGKINE